jgi:hypothetical protein
MVGRQIASALSWRCFLNVCRQLQHPPPTQICPYPLRRQKTAELQVPTVNTRVFDEHLALKSNIGLAMRRILARMCD